MSERTTGRIDRSAAVAPPTTARANAQPSTLELMRRAADESSEPLDRSVRGLLERRLAHDFSRVRVHSGPNTTRAAERIGARAYALGSDIHLGAEAVSLSSRERATLLAHEAVHTAQQGGAIVAPRVGLVVGDANSQAEHEAERVAQTIGSQPLRSGAHALSEASHMSSPTSLPKSTIARVPSPLIQRNLTGKRTSLDGDFDLGLKVTTAGGSTGLQGTIKFKPSAKAPDSKNIRLLQVVRDEDLTTGKDYVWTGGEANRNKMMTTADAKRGVDPGYFVDHSAAAATPRTAKTDAAVSPYYRDYWPNATQSQDGSKKGAVIKEASLWDFPGSGGKRRFSFETAAKAVDTGYIYATLTWGFTISDPAKGEITGQHADAHFVQSSTFNAAVDAFDKFYKNPGASTAP